MFRLVFESVVATCMKVGLVGGEGFAVDASVVEADASRYQRVEGSEVLCVLVHFLGFAVCLVMVTGLLLVVIVTMALFIVGIFVLQLR